MAKVIAFYGKEKGDFAYYIGKSLASNDKLVACIDNSYTKDLFDAVHHIDFGNETVVEKENIVYLRDALVNEGFSKKFDYILYYQGLNRQKVPCDYVFIMPGYTYSEVNEAKNLGEEFLSRGQFILRDKTCGKISEKSIASTLSISLDQIIGYLPLELKDEIAYLNFTYSGRQKIGDLSSELQYAILTVIAIVTEEDFGTVKKIYRKAKRVKRL